MKKIIIILLCLSSFSYAFWFDTKPKCNDKVVLQILKEILDKDEWIYVEYGLDEKSLKALYLSLNGMDLRELEALLSTDTLGVLKASFKSLFDLKEYANEFVYTRFSDFITEENESKKITYCQATLTITYPQMSKEMFQRYKNGSLKGALFKGGDIEENIRYSARYTDDGTKIYVEFLDN
ncbi:hypothetical protein DU474_02670 [Campylobacter novaezeelandiae]|uniref:hypothetical protein n=1 Tax=Campylobacter novaezeelandiae TaxID=2267891 RepID=UPI0010370506|nr:hypothetical protein [Campylobacter novaezeelandiae]TBR79879.1 hypothetical protein DU474_02670 [Campylobacter novaezeelandiae]